MPTDGEAHDLVGDTPWDKGAAAAPLLEWLGYPANRFHGEVLVPGCGLGHDVRAIAATGQAAVIVGLDLSPTALAQASRFPPAGQEKYIEADLFKLPAEFHGRFDWIFEHTCFCAIDPGLRPKYVRAVADALKPGGRLLVIFYLNPWKDEESRPPGGNPPFPREVAELDTFFSIAFAVEKEWVPTRSYAGGEGRELVRLFTENHQ